MGNRLNMGCGCSGAQTASAPGGVTQVAPKSNVAQTNDAKNWLEKLQGEEHEIKQQVAERIADYEARVADCEYDPQQGEHSKIIEEGRALIKAFSESTFQKATLKDEIDRIEEIIARHKKARGAENIQDLKNIASVTGHFVVESKEQMKQAAEVQEEIIPQEG